MISIGFQVPRSIWEQVQQQHLKTVPQHVVLRQRQVTQVKYRRTNQAIRGQGRIQIECRSPLFLAQINMYFKPRSHCNKTDIYNLAIHTNESLTISIHFILEQVLSLVQIFTRELTLDSSPKITTSLTQGCSGQDLTLLIFTVERLNI